MEMHQVRYFLAVADTLNFTKAAEKCNVTQPALSRAIQQLEEEVGGLLLRRECTQTHLTDLGKLMRPYLEQVLDQSERAKREAKSFLKMDRAELQVGLLNTIGPLHFTGFLARFHKDHPGIKLNIVEGSPAGLVAKMEAGELEVAIMASAATLPERFDQFPLYVERFMVAFPPAHPFEKIDGVRPKDMNGVPYLRRLNCEYRAHIGDVLERHGARIDVQYQSEREDWIQAMVLAGLGVSTFPEFSPVLRGLSFRPYVEPEIKRQVNLVTVAGRRHAPALASFVKAVKAYDWKGD